MIIVQIKMNPCVDPAYAGMNPWTLAVALWSLCGPRVCGDEPQQYIVDFICFAWTPRMRG